VNIARGFAHAYPALLLDEPTASLDAANREVVLTLIEEAKARGAAILGIFHDEARARPGLRPAGRCDGLQPRGWRHDRLRVVGPSGAGKDTLIAGAMAQRPDLRLVRRVITRPEEAGGEPFRRRDRGRVRRAQGAGRLRPALAGAWAALWHPARSGRRGRGQTVLFNGSRAALPRRGTVFPDLQVILITAPDAVLARALRARARERGRHPRPSGAGGISRCPTASTRPR
jgi:ribose 1,5-bisphosphokinase